MMDLSHEIRIGLPKHFLLAEVLPIYIANANHNYQITNTIDSKT